MLWGDGNMENNHGRHDTDNVVSTICVWVDNGDLVS